MEGMGVVIAAVAVLAAAEFILPHFIGDSYYFAKWRVVAVFFVIMLVWILLTPNGCQMPG